MKSDPFKWALTLIGLIAVCLTAIILGMIVDGDMKTESIEVMKIGFAPIVGIALTASGYAAGTMPRRDDPPR